MIRHPLRRRVHAPRLVEDLERPRPASRERLGGGTGLGRRAEAADEYRAALRLVDNTRERAFLTARLAECDIAD